jgi:hypothetical protein
VLQEEDNNRQGLRGVHICQVVLLVVQTEIKVGRQFAAAARAFCPHNRSEIILLLIVKPFDISTEKCKTQTLPNLNSFDCFTKRGKFIQRDYCQ